MVDSVFSLILLFIPDNSVYLTYNCFVMHCTKLAHSYLFKPFTFYFSNYELLR